MCIVMFEYSYKVCCVAPVFNTDTFLIVERACSDFVQSTRYYCVCVPYSTHSCSINTTVYKTCLTSSTRMHTPKLHTSTGRRSEDYPSLMAFFSAICVLKIQWGCQVGGLIHNPTLVLIPLIHTRTRTNS